MSKNMMRPKSDYTKVKMNYSIVAPRMYKGRIESLVSRITGFADMIQLTHLKLQQVMSRMVPDGVCTLLRSSFSKAFKHFFFFFLRLFAF
jgi:hypothetical protein